MKHKMLGLVVCVSLGVLVLGSCSSESPLAPGPETGDIQSHFHSKTYVPVAVQSATLHIYALETNDAPVNVHRITGPWDEATTTWRIFNGQYAPEVEASFTVEVAGWRIVDVTDLAAGWVGGLFANHGLLLDQSLEGTPWAKYHSRESGLLGPMLEICFLTAAGDVVCESLEATADTYVWELRPDTVHGSQPVLYTGWKPPSELVKQSLIAFDIPEIPDEPGSGCTRTQGYWKTHSEFGPAPYDNTWAQLENGASTMFFLSNQTYHQVLWTQPVGGNAYYILAHQYIAAELNMLGGADLSAVQAAFDAATHLFNTRTPAQIRALRGQARNEILALAGQLDDYNNGLIGPGHCDD